MYLLNSSNHTTPSFTCRIERTPFYEAGIKRSKELIRLGTEEGLSQVNKFINNMELIKNDTSINKLNIDAYPGDIFHFLFPGLHTVKVDGQKAKEFTIENISSSHIGDYFIEAINNFVERQYGQKAVNKVAEKQIPELGKLAELSIKLDSATASAQRKLSSMVKTIDVQI